MKSLSYLNKYFRKYRLRFALGVVFIIISSLFAVYSPIVVQQAVDFIKTAADQGENIDPKTGLVLDTPDVIKIIQDQTGLMSSIGQPLSNKSDVLELIVKTGFFLAIIYLLIYLFKGIFLFLTRQTIIIMSRLIEYDLKNEIYDHYQKLSVAFYKRNNTGDLMNRISEDVSKVRMYLGPAVMYTTNMLVIFVLSIVFMINISPKMTFYVLTPLPIMSVIIYWVSSIINRKSEAVQRQQSKLSTFVQEAFSGIRVLKAYNREVYSQHRFKEESNAYKDVSLSLVKVNALFMPTIILLIGLSTILTIFVGGMMIINNEGGITIGKIASFVIYVNMLTWPFAAVGWVTSLVQRAAASQSRINEFLHVQPEIFGGDQLLHEPIRSIKFNEVSFTYPDSGIQAINKLSFEIQKGSSLAIIGHTGSGKSTIAQLLLRQYEPNSGKISLNGVDLNSLNMDDIRTRIGYVPQEVFLFSEPISNNIAFGIKDITDANRIHEAAKSADVYNNIMEFPKKFETPLGERGITLSGGQKQRVSIARAIIKDPDLLIFDDSLSAVDTKTEDRILARLKEMMKDKITIFISHRVSTVKDADLIIVLEDGQLEESGNHSSLMKLEGKYALLYQKQLWEEQKILSE